MKSEGLILSIDKPADWTSFDVVAKLRNTLGWKKVGHAGTLDPPATGILIILCGSAVRRANEFMALHKEYYARIRFGLTTTTDDLAGEILTESRIIDWNEDRIHQTLQGFTGEIEQVPPAVSAVKVKGRRSYDLARSGNSVPLEPRIVNIYSIELLKTESPEIEIRVICSRGTYIRSLARDLGRVLGWGGALATLRRTAIGPYRIENALTINEVIRRAQEFSAH